jgi:hypothetical protein
MKASNQPADLYLERHGMRSITSNRSGPSEKNFPRARTVMDSGVGLAPMGCA